MKERIERNCSPEPNTGCWLWMGKLDADGYGQLRNRTGTQAYLKAHRVAYEEFIGPIPEGQCVCHSCDVRSCVNPRHLWLGTHRENHRDRIAKGRSAKGEAIKSAKLTEETVLAIRASKSGLMALAKQFGVAPQTIHRIRRKELWRHV